MKRVFFLLSLLGVVFQPLAAQDVSLDKKLGAENAALVELEMGIYHHDSLYNLVNSVGKKLVSRLRQNPFEFKFFLVDSSEPNAFALPGGYVYVTRGILPLIQTEDELAGIMAHEIIHVTQRHSVKQMKKGIVTGLLSVPGNVINTVTGTRIGNIINVPIALSTKAFISKYSRGHEKEADEFGIQLAASAGYNPASLADALERLSYVVEYLTSEVEQHDYFSDHPFTPSRVSSIRNSAPFYKPVNPSPVTRSEEKFLVKFNGLCFGQNPEQGIFKDSLFVQPTLGFSWMLPVGWQTMNKPMVVAGYNEEGDAVVSLGVTDGKKNIHEIGEEAKTKSMKAEGVTIEFAGDTTINSLPAYQLRLKSVDKKETAKIELIWLNLGGTIFQLSGVSTLELTKPVHQSLCSFKKANKEELALVYLYQLQYVKALKGETIDQLSIRTGNRLELSFTALLNNTKPETRLDDGAGVKIIKSFPYQPKK